VAEGVSLLGISFFLCIPATYASMKCPNALAVNGKQKSPFPYRMKGLVAKSWQNGHMRRRKNPLEAPI